ncbi:MAG: helix-turn-helix domain-containing protein [Rhizobiales bacterium]|nr:helix-turn-helix domain-containing protein [Hyphomicrobiales bacterium]
MTKHGATGRDRFQQICDDKGEVQYVLVPAAIFDQLSRAQEDLEDVRAALTASTFGMARLEGVPAEVAHRIAAGEHPVRVWRECRGLKGIELAREAGISPAYLSEIETAKKDGTFRIMAAIAKVLGVSLDDLAPPSDEAARRERECVALADGVRAQIRDLVLMVTGPTDFNTGGVRRAATRLIGDASALRHQNPALSEWLDTVLDRAKSVIELVDHAEGEIIGTARQARRDLELIVAQPDFVTHQANAEENDAIPAGGSRIHAAE